MIDISENIYRSIYRFKSAATKRGTGAVQQAYGEHGGARRSLAPIRTRPTALRGGKGQRPTTGALRDRKKAIEKRIGDGWGVYRAVPSVTWARTPQSALARRGTVPPQMIFSLPQSSRIVFLAMPRNVDRDARTATIAEPCAFIDPVWPFIPLGDDPRATAQKSGAVTPPRSLPVFDVGKSPMRMWTSRRPAYVSLSPGSKGHLG